MRRSLLTLTILLLGATTVSADQGIRLEGYRYPFPEETFHFNSQRQPLEMVYMDVAPSGTPRGVVVLLHGKNFSGSYFGQTATVLREAGYRVIIPDQIGFGKSSKPEHYQFTFQQLAWNTHALLKSRGIEHATILGHSMGGMIAARYALMFPESTTALVLADPLGLEDWKALGVPYVPIDEQYRQELAKTPEQIRKYEQESYYDGKWSTAYDPWVEQLASFTKSPDYHRMAWDQALTSDMIFTQPVVYEFPKITEPTLLIIGQRDRTAIGKAAAPPDVRQKLGHYPELGRAAHAAIHDSELVEIPNAGHLPHIETFDAFFPPLKKFLDRVSSATTEH